MSVKVAINGFGRIGRLAFRQMFGAEGYEVVAINDLTKPSMLADLLKYDTAQGGYCGKIGENLHTVSADDEANTITVDGKTLTIYKEADANNLPWGKIGVDVVLECTGFYCSKEKSMAHINAGAKKVVISAPAGNDLKTIVFSVNQDTLTADDPERKAWEDHVKSTFGNFDFTAEPLPMSISTHIGYGAYAVACSCYIPELEGE